MTKEFEAIAQLRFESLQLAIRLIASQVRWDMIKFFKANPFSIHTAHGLAGMIGRRPITVEAEAEELVKAEVLRRISQEDEAPPIYSYDPEPEVKMIVDLLDNACDIDGGRVKKLNTLLKEL